MREGRYGPQLSVYKEKKGQNKMAGHKTENVEHFRHEKGVIQ